MKVINLVPWSGAMFSHAPGDIIELADDIAYARIAALLCAPAGDPPVDPSQDDQTGARIESKKSKEA